MLDKPRERIEATAARTGWSVHFGGWQTLRGVTLVRGQHVIAVDLDTRNRITRGALRTTAGEVLERVQPADRDKCRRIIGIMERMSK